MVNLQACTIMRLSGSICPLTGTQYSPLNMVWLAFIVTVGTILFITFVAVCLRACAVNRNLRHDRLRQPVAGSLDNPLESHPPALICRTQTKSRLTLLPS